jgi:predicted O-linked N-acetylglucosamine transferase (SPINDLY family)
VVCDGTNAHAWHLLGVLNCKTGDLTQGISCIERAISLAPQEATFYSNLGSFLLSAARKDEAEQVLRRAVELRPDLAAAWTTLGYVLGQLGRSDEATEAFERAASLAPRDASTWRGLAHAHAELGAVEQSVAAFQKALRKSPDAAFRINAAAQLPLVYESVEDVLEWRRFIEGEIDLLYSAGFRQDVRSQVATPIFSLAHQGFNDRELMSQLAQLYEPPAVPESLWKSNASSGLRVGFVSSYFGSHTIGKLSRGLIAGLSQRDLNVTVFSVDRHSDEVGATIAKSPQRFVVLPRDLERARQVVLENSVDVLVYTDLGMDATTFTLAFSRLAPVQCATWGHPDTTGIPTIDYFVSSTQMEVKDAVTHYSEKLVRLPGLTFAFKKTFVPAKLRDRASFGLDPRKRLYGCPQAIYKFHPKFDEALAKILRADPDGQVVLTRWLYPQVDRLLQQRFQKTMPDVADRIIFLDRLKEPDFMNLLSLFDVMLDPFPYGGGNTTLEALSVGLPVVTLPTEFLRGRITQALCRRVGIESCIARDLEDYCNIAMRLANDRPFREQVRQQILVNQGKLFEDEVAIGDWEKFFQSVR